MSANSHSDRCTTDEPHATATTFIRVLRSMKDPHRAPRGRYRPCHDRAGKRGLAMAIAVDPSTGLLTPGMQSCSWGEIVTTFVENAPNRPRRELQMKALEVYVARIDELLPDSTLWLDGGFASLKPDPPFDIDVVVVAKPGEWGGAHEGDEGGASRFRCLGRGGPEW